MTESAEEYGDRMAIKLDDAELSYALLDGASKHVAGLLHEKGFKVGDRVGIMLPNVPYFAAIYYGVLRAGGVVVPMNPLLKGREVAFYLSDSQARVLFVAQPFAAQARGGAIGTDTQVVEVGPAF